VIPPKWRDHFGGIMKTIRWKLIEGGRGDKHFLLSQGIFFKQE